MFEEIREVVGFKLSKGLVSSGEYEEALDAVKRLVGEYYRTAVEMVPLVKEVSRRIKRVRDVRDEVYRIMKDRTELNSVYLYSAFQYVLDTIRIGVPVEKGLVLLDRRVFRIADRFFWLALPMERVNGKWIYEKVSFELNGDVDRIKGKKIVRAWLVVPNGDVEKGVFVNVVVSGFVPVGIPAV